MVNKQHIKDLKKNGYVIIENLIDDAQTEKVAKELDHWFDKTPACKGDFYGQGTTTRFGSLLSKAPSTQDLVLAPELTSLVDAFLSEHCDWYQLSLSQAVRIHPGAPMQPVHKDELMWPHDKNYEWMINVIWAIDDFKEEKPYEVLFRQVYPLIIYWYQHHTERLLQALYRIDLPEEKIKTQMAAEQVEDLPKVLTDLILKRTLQKVCIRNHFKSR